ncbi:probable G-protein coupled receptor 179 [Pogoniulus pusillus]|uniref:probable G-protein coupled receptor 179 n=1 Tax=Pogoniulus pusillus TaxID=488313 RepID=UPI0030B9869D
MGRWPWPWLWCLHTVLVHGTILVGAQRQQQRPPRLAGWSPASSSSSSWMPTAVPGPSKDPEGTAAAMLYLQTGDAQRLARANCSRGVVAGAAGASPPATLRATLRAAPEALAQAANFLNMLFQTNDIREASVAEDVEWYQALVRSLAEGHPWVYRAVLALDAHPLAAKPRLMLQATKGDDEILLQDVSAAAPSLGNLSWDNEWFNSFKSQRTPPLRKRLLSNDLSSMDTPKWQRGDSYVGDPSHVRWSPPFLQCQDGKFLPTWLVTLSSAFYGLKPDLSPEFKGVVRVDIELRDVGIDQCSTGPGWFADTHRCDLNSTQCVPQESNSFVLGRYLCRCRAGFYRAAAVPSGARAGSAGTEGGARLACQPCRQGCATCEDDAPCLIQEDRALRAAVLSCQACCMLAVFLSMLISYHYRRSKRIRTSGVVLLETILFGSLLLYFPVFILYFKPSIFRCIVLRWVRLLGFATVYGTITLKLYRVLKVFLSRSAQRVPCVSSQRVLKMLGLILLLVLWFLAAWTIGMLENLDKNIPLVVRAQTARGLHFYICSHDHWDYMMVIAEMLFLLWGSFLCYATRAVPSAFHEPRYMGIALHNELMISATFHVVRFIMVPSLHPDWTLLLFFAHTHGTITMTLALLFIPKFLHAGSPLREEIAAEVYEDELDPGRSGSCLTSSLASAWSEHSLDPDDIREELKKLYLQLEVHKARKVASNNPHLAKRRSSRRSLLRSLSRRGAEPPELPPRRSSGSCAAAPPGDRAGTPARRSSSAEGLPDATGASLRTRDEGSRRRAAALRKSGSAEGARREPSGGSPSSPGHLERKRMAVTPSEPSDSESLDAAPLACRSASAHNLAAPGRLALPRAAPLHKSLSAGAQDEAVLAASRAAWHHQWHPAVAPGPPEAAAVPAAGSSPSQSSSQRSKAAPGDAKAQKRVTYAPGKSVSADGSHPPGRVRVAVKRTPPPPPVRCQSLGQRATAAAGSLEAAEPPPEPLAPAAGPQGTAAEEALGGTAPRAGKGRLLPAASIPAQVCPWELVQDEILSQKQKAAEAADLGTPGDTAATGTPKPSLQKTSLRSLGLALKAFNRSRGRGILRGRREGEGSLRRRGQEGGSRKERLSLAQTSATAPEGSSQGPTTKSPEWQRQRPSSEPTAHPWQGHTAPCQHNNNAGTTRGAEGWGDRGAEGHGDSPALGSGTGEKLAEELSTPQGGADAGGAREAPLGVHIGPPSAAHREAAEGPPGSLAGGSSGEAQTQCQEGAEPGKEAPAAPPGLVAPREAVAGLNEGLGVSTQPEEHTEVEQPLASSLHPSSAAAKEPGAGVCPQGAPSVPSGRGALLRQQAVASREDGEVPPGTESPARLLQKGRSQPELLGPGGTSWSLRRVPPRSRSVDVAPGPAGRSSREAEGDGAGEAQAEPRSRVETWEEGRDEGREAGRAPGEGGREGVPGGPGGELGAEKPPKETPELPKAESVEGRRAEVCPWEAGEGGRSRADICPWDTEGTRPEQERLKAGRRQNIRASPGALLGAQGSGSRGSSSAEAPPKPAPKSSEPSLKAAPQSSELPLKAAPQSSEPPAVSPRSLLPTLASVCPWEVAGADGAAEVCPWERAAAPARAGKVEGSAISRVENGIALQGASLGGTGKRAPEVGSSLRASPRAVEGGEQPSTGLAAGHPAQPKALPQGAGATGSRKGNVCPWEVEDEPRPGAEICPWEEPAAPLGKARLRQDSRGAAKGESKAGTGGLEGVKAKSKESQSVESKKAEVCPWESTDREQPPGKAPARSPELPKDPSSKSQSRESLKAEVCPWDAPEEEPAQRAEICPWESTDQEQPQGKAPARSPELPKAPSRKSQSGDSLKAEICPWDAPEVEPAQRAEICPWESTDREQLPLQTHSRSPELPKAPSKKSQSRESLKAEICPWDAPEEEPTQKAEICPWEVSAPPPSKEKPRQGKEALPMVSRSSPRGEDVHREPGERAPGRKEAASSGLESICPWESPGTESSSPGHGTSGTELQRVTSKRSESTGTVKAELCPWEAAGEGSTQRAEICPWESTDQEQPQGKAPARSPELPKDPSRKSQSGDSLKAEVCPWESTDREQLPPQTHSRSPELPKDPSRKSQSGDSLKAEICPWDAPEEEPTERAEICPWESTDREQPPGKAPARSPELPKDPPRKSQSRESLKAEICPWEAAGGESAQRAEICPWESTDQEQPQGKAPARSPELPKAPSRKSQSGDSLKAEVCPWDAPEEEPTERAEICPWESTDREQPQGKAPARSSELPKDPSRKSQSGDSLKAEICPWDAPEEEPTQRAEICPWESTDKEQPQGKAPARSPELPKDPSRKSQSGDSLKAEVCPWEAAEEEPAQRAEICPWEVSAPLPEQAEAKVPAQAAASQAAQKGSSEREAICPWQSLGTEEPSLRTSTDTEPPQEGKESSSSELCPWEAAEPSSWQQESCPPGAGRALPAGLAEAEPLAGGSSTSAPALLKASKGRLRSEAEHKPLCRISGGIQHPRGARAAPQLGRASLDPTASSSPSPGSSVGTVCPWEAAEALAAAGGASTGTSRASEVCPWEVESADPAQGCQQGRAKETQQDGARAGSETKPEVCPWDHE